MGGLSPPLPLPTPIPILLVREHPKVMSHSLTQQVRVHPHKIKAVSHSPMYQVRDHPHAYVAAFLGCYSEVINSKNSEASRIPTH